MNPEGGFQALVDADLEPILPVFYADVDRCMAELEAAIAAGDEPHVRRIGHQLKGIGGPYGFPQVSALGGAFQTAAPETFPRLLRTLAEGMAGKEVAFR